MPVKSSRGSVIHGRDFGRMQQARLMVLGVIFAFAIDAAIVWIFFALTSQEFTWSAVWYWVLIVWAVTFGLWVRRTIVKLLWYAFIGKRTTVELYVNYMMDNDMPYDPSAHIWDSTDPDQWLTDVITDEALDPKARIAAGKLGAELSGITQMTPISGMLARSAMKEALTRYGRLLKLNQKKHQSR